MKLFQVVFCVMSCCLIMAQTPVVITDNTFKIKGNSEEILFVGLSENDVLHVDFKEIKDNAIKSIELSKYDATPFFTAFKTNNLDKEFNIYKTGVYQIKLINDGMLARICKLKLIRTPASSKTQNFNSTVYWKRDQDTLFEKNFQKFTIKKDTTVLSVVDQVTKISSKNALNGNDNVSIVDFTLPDNTVAWSYYIGVGKEGKEAYNQAIDGTLKSAIKLISSVSSYGAMASLAIHGINLFNKAQGGDNVKYWFIKDEKSLNAFRNKEKFYQYKQGDVINDASQMKNPLKGKVYLGLQNDNIIEPIEVFVTVTAVTVVETKIKNVPKNFSLTTQQVPYLKE